MRGLETLEVFAGRPVGNSPISAHWDHNGRGVGVYEDSVFFYQGRMMGRDGNAALMRSMKSISQCKTEIGGKQLAEPERK
jgi:hypothetical protein